MELLVIVAILAILLALLLPVLNRAMKKAQAVQCANNLRQLYIACEFFAQDQGGRLPRPHQTLDLSNNAAAAGVCVWLHTRVDGAGHADLADGSGALWRYLNGGRSMREDLVACPADAGERPLGVVVRDDLPRNYSYSLNWLVTSPRDVARGGTLPFQPGIKRSGVMQPAEKIMWYEELAPGDTANRTQLDLFEAPGGRHGIRLANDPRVAPISLEYTRGGLGNFCFFDGHVAQLTAGEVLDPRNSRWHRPLAQGDAW